MRIAARGRIERDGKETRFRIDGWEDAYPIEGDDLKDGARTLRLGVRFTDGKPHLHVVEE
ncbi:MAG TPA: hypothetical protein VFY93_14435 [Planctomycetota bacterium]|nr:hypothetical protein [Planctomycetota bacterium]